MEMMDLRLLFGAQGVGRSVLLGKKRQVSVVLHAACQVGSFINFVRGSS